MIKTLALPIKYGTVRLYVDRGSRWTLIEHALLYQVCQERSSARGLAEDSGLPYRLVIEILSRLMKAGWVAAHETRVEVLFSATENGLLAVEKPELPRIPNPSDRVAKFVLEGYTGGCFRYNDFGRVVSQSRLSQLQEKNEIVILDDPKSPIYAAEADLLDVLLQDEELFQKFGDEQSRVSNRFCLLNVHGEVIHGLPSSASERLKGIIIAAVDSPSQGPSSDKGADRHELNTEFQGDFRTVSARIDVNDALVIGGPAHLEAVRKALAQAEELVIIHSTFVNPKTFELLVNEFRVAYERGVRIQILWGQGISGDRKGSTSTAVKQCEDLLRSRSGGASIVNFEYFSTGSHAKILAYDLPSGHMACVIGSCNWLSSSYDSLECSLRVRDPAIVVPILRYLTELARPYPGGTSPLISSLVARTLRLKGIRYTHGVGVRIALIAGGQHNQVIRTARDKAVKDVLVFSHRLGDGADNLIVAPLSEAASKRSIDVDIYYSKDDRNERLSISRADSPVQVHECREPRMHAKCLLWDTSNLLVTSQNLCSADPPDNAHLSELGILVSCPSLAQAAIDSLKGTLLEVV